MSSRVAEADILPSGPYYPVGNIKTPPLAALYNEVVQKPSSVSIKVGGRDLSGEEEQAE